MFSCTRANLKYDTNTSRRIGRVYVLRSDFEQIRFQEKKRSFHTLLQLFPSIDASLGSLSNDEGAVNKNVTKATGLDWQNNNFARASRFFVHFFSLPSLHDYEVKLPNFTFFEGREHRTTAFYLFFWISIQPQKKLPTFDEMIEME